MKKIILLFSTILLLSCNKPDNNINSTVDLYEGMIADTICDIRVINAQIYTWEDMVNITTQFDTDTLSNEQKDVLKIILTDLEKYGIDNYKKHFEN